ncbi:MAG: ATPase, T2SS/T4P/T4SS family [Deltaproteobacteria bacterium]|nr:ATPase, T2SS/T4P/T4SS family [Deltaproteobacteria bacterium]
MELSLGDMLVRAGVVTREACGQAVSAQRRHGGSLVAALAREGTADEGRLMAFMGERFGLEETSLTSSDVDEGAFGLLPLSLLRKHQLLPFARTGSVLDVAVSDPTDLAAVDEIRFMTGHDVRTVLARPSTIERLLGQLSGASDSGALVREGKPDGGGREAAASSPATGRPRGTPEPGADTTVVALVDSLMKDAVARGASDIHIEPYEDSVRVRFRIDGVLREVMTPRHEVKHALTSRIKVMSGLDIAEHRLPQDGRLKLEGAGGEVDVRVSVLPTRFGEKVVLRLLHRSDLVTSLDGLGLDARDRELFTRAMGKPAGMILLTGPTGSGKSTTLYGMLSELNRPGVNISTAEDPVEYHLAGINQVQTHADIGLTFAACLRAFLRQDPDILMVGEIRDAETARIAVNAALTGHLVLTTLHTNDAPSSVHRLLDMGVEPYLIASAVTMVAAQRLLRRVCDACRVRAASPEGVPKASGAWAEEVRDVEDCRGAGCPECHHTGYRGRAAIYEVMTLTEELQRLVLGGAPATELKASAVAQGMRTLRQAAVGKVGQGVTTVEEALRVTDADTAG